MPNWGDRSGKNGKFPVSRKGVSLPRNGQKRRLLLIPGERNFCSGCPGRGGRLAVASEEEKSRTISGRGARERFGQRGQE